MADFTALKATIQQYIKQNGNEEITGAILQDVLLSMVNTMGDGAINTLTQNLSDEITARGGADSIMQGNIDSLGLSLTALATFVSSGYIFRGIANQSTVPSTLNGKVFYLTSTSGQYSNMGNITVQAGISALLYDGEAWSAVLLIAMDNAPTEDSGNMVKSGGVHSAIASEAARALAAETNSVEFNSTTKYLIFKNSAGTVLYQMDASVFVIDGMVQNVEIKDVTISGQTVTCLVISFNTDAGKQDINIPLTQIFNPANYYDKTAIDTLLLPVTTRLNAGYLYMGLATVAGTPDTSKGKVFYLTATAGTYTNYGNTVVADGLTILSYDGTSWTGTLWKGLDSTPTQNSTNLITSGGVQNELALGAVYDVSAKNPTAGPNSDGKWESLSALLSDANLNTLIPTSVRKGGMSIKFVQSSDNKYVQYRLMADEWSTAVSDWLADNLCEVKESGNYLFSLLDANDNVVAGITKDLKLVCPDNFLDIVLQKPLSLKVDISDIVDNLTTQRFDVPLSANQGYVLKGIIDAINARLGNIESAITFISNDKYIIAIVDADEKVLWGIEKNGELDEPTRYKESLNWLFAITDNADNVVFGILKNGEIFAPGLKVSKYDSIITELQEETQANSEAIVELQDAVRTLDAVDDSIEVAIGKQKSYGNYDSELAAMSINNQSDDYYVGYKTIGKDKALHNTKKMFIVLNHDDGFPGDLTATRRIYNKYGFKASICAVFFPFESLSYAKTLIPNYRKWLNDGHEIGLHAIMQGSYWYYNRLYDVKPDGSTNFAPLISELRGSNQDGTGTNTFGKEITVDTTIRNAGYGGLFLYNTASLDVKVIEATQAQVDDVNRGLCFYGDRFTLNGIEDLEIEDVMHATSATVVSKTRLQWLEYYYNRLVEEIGYSSSSSDIASRFAEDYDYPSGSNASDYYPDAEHLLNGKMVYYGDTTNPHYSDVSYQKVGKFTKGLFKGCYSCCNWEVMDRVVSCAEAFFRHYFGLNHFTDMHRHGVGYAGSFSYVYDDFHYMDREHTILYDCHDKFYISHRNSWMSVIDVMQEHGFDILKENVSRLALDLEGQVGYYYGQQGIKSVNGFGGTATEKGSFTNYLAMFGIGSSGMEDMSYNSFMTYMQGVDNWFKFCYENAGQSITQNGLTRNVYSYIKDIAREIVGCIGTGKVLALSVDTINKSASINMATELVLRFLKDIGVDVLSWGAGRDKILSMDRDIAGNLFPNPGFNQTLLDYLGGESNINTAYIPDGWYSYGGNGEFSVANEEDKNGVETRVLTITGSGRIETYIWGLQQGKYKLSYDVKSSVSGSCNFRSFKNGDKLGSYTTVDDYTHTSDWTTRDVEFEVPAPHKNPVDRTNPISIICDGYEDNIFKYMLRVNAWDVNNILKLTNVKLYKI